MKQYLIEKYLGESLKSDTLNKMNNIPELKKIAKQVVSYKKGDNSLSMAKVKTANAMSKLAIKIGQAYETGKKFDLEKELNKKDYKGVTEPFSNWIKDYGKALDKNLF